MSTDRVISVVSYNIHRCIGMDGVMDPERVARVIRETSPDIVGLQEVNVDGAGDISSRQIDYLEQATGLRSVFRATLKNKENLYGNALLTSGAFLGDRHHDLSVTRREPRGAIDARIELAGQTIAVIVTHIGLDARERRVQAKKLSEIVPEDMPFVILMGDFNEWRAKASSLRPLEQRLGSVRSAPRTFPSRFPLFPLDRIWVRPKRALLNVAAHRSATARAASDHLPLVAQVSVTSAAGADDIQLPISCK